VPGSGAQEQQQHELALFRARRRYDLLMRIFSAGSPLGIAALYFPFRGAVPIVEALSGESTSISVKASIGVTITYALAITIGAIVLVVRNQARSSEIQRLRERLGEEVP